MVQFRAMGDDASDVDEVLDVAHAWLRECPGLVVGPTTRLRHRNGGGRLVFEVMLARPANPPERVQAERIDVQPARSPRADGGRRAAGPPHRRELPPGRSR
ncbi:hypothetical protein SAMN05421505_16810 [Sinosporangium album]|uniref:Uncharacterized protein n=1 Tax=Sinosporangium album TaxID=504805 RepID=A0A1G8LHT3_9ACTN|nr:hypothetical protein [Sinosporangium album]SDI55213.1 hypothetical protein SAMN05421505_16810 [Sinosporangium album]